MEQPRRKRFQVHLSTMIVLATLPLHSAEPDPLWDGYESVAAYAARAHLEPTKTLDLPNGIKMELVLIPAGQFTMGAPEPGKPSVSVDGASLLVEFGGIAVLALLLEQLLRVFPERRTAFSLRWLFLMMIAAGVCIGGIARRTLAVQELTRYEKDLVAYQAVPENEKPAHPAAIPKAFYMGKYTVTQEQFEAIALAANSRGQWRQPKAGDPKRSNYPATHVTWKDANKYIATLNDNLKVSLNIPTEEQWEYACRADLKTPSYIEPSNADLDPVAWYGMNSGGKTHPVGGKKPNAFGLFDMYGNVLQWCVKSHDEKEDESYALGTKQPLRGSPFCGGPFACRASRRGFSTPGSDGPHIGFRVVLSTTEPRTVGRKQ